MKNEILEVKKKLEHKKNKIGLVGTRLTVQEVSGSTLAAHITTDWKDMEISYGRDLNLVPDKETEIFVNVRGINNPTLKTGEDIVEHEAGHRENPVGQKYGCPHDLITHETIKDSIARGLSKIGKKGLESYVTNAFEDVLDNINCRRNTDFAGQTLFWNNQGLYVSQDKKFNPFYDAFVKVNLVLAGRAADYSLLKRFMTDKPEVKTATQAFLEDLKNAAGEEQVFRLHEKPGFQRLFDSSNLRARAERWAQLGYSFAINLGPLLEQMPNERMFSSEQGDENSPEQNPFDREMKMPSKREDVAYDRFTQGKAPLTHREIKEQLYSLYRKISREIPVEASHYSASQQMPLVNFGKRFIDQDEKKFRFRGIGITRDGDLTVKTTKHSINYPISYKVHPHQFPKFKLALMDRSASMAKNPDGGEYVGSKSFIPWGDKSKYHFALKGYFGIENFLERQGISQYVESCALGFSGEQSIRGRGEVVARSLLVDPNGSGTSLDIDGLEKELEENALVLSISDGEFSLDYKSRERFENKISCCDYAHIQIGGKTEYSQYLRGLNVPVVVVKGDEDLARTMVSFVSGYYKNKPCAGART